MHTVGADCDCSLHAGNEHLLLKKLVQTQATPSTKKPSCSIDDSNDGEAHGQFMKQAKDQPPLADLTDSACWLDTWLRHALGFKLGP